MTVIAQDDHLTAGTWAACGYTRVTYVFLLDYMQFYSLNILFLSSSLKASGFARHIL